MTLVKQYVIFLLIYAFFSFFQTPIMPLTDAMTLESRIPFGAVRKWGAIGFAVGVFFGRAAGRSNKPAYHIPLVRIWVYPSRGS